MPKLVKGYHTKADGTVVEQELYEGDLRDAVSKFPDEWSKTPPKSANAASAPKKAKKGS